LDIYTRRYNSTKFSSGIELETKIEFLEKGKSASLGSACTRRPSRAQRSTSPTAQTCEAAHDVRPTRERSLGEGDRRRCRRKCDLAPELTAIYTTKSSLFPQTAAKQKHPSPFPSLHQGGSRRPSAHRRGGERHWPATPATRESLQCSRGEMLTYKATRDDGRWFEDRRRSRAAPPRQRQPARGWCRRSGELRSWQTEQGGQRASVSYPEHD
jgi:hypothetical protein